MMQPTIGLLPISKTKKAYKPCKTKYQERGTKVPRSVFYVFVKGKKEKKVLLGDFGKHKKEGNERNTRCNLVRYKKQEKKAKKAY